MDHQRQSEGLERRDPEAVALCGEGIVCLSDFMTHEDRKEGRLVQILAEHTWPEVQQVHAVYYRHTSQASRIRVFIDFLAENLPGSEGPLRSQSDPTDYFEEVAYNLSRR